MTLITAAKETINKTVQGQRHLGAAIGSREYVEEYVDDKVTNWISEITKLAEFAVTQPQASYAADTFGLKHRRTYFLRTLPDIQDLLDLDYTSSVKVTVPLNEQIMSQVHQLPEDFLIRSAQQEVRAERAKNLEIRAERLKEVTPQKTRCALDLATEKGWSMWLISLPLQEMGFNLNKREFRDGLSLRYDWPVTNISSAFPCGEPFTIDHAMICMRWIYNSET